MSARCAATYVPHPWDAIGPPPPFGEPYEAETDEAERTIEPGEVDRVLALIGDMEAAEGRADELERDAEEERDRADDAREEARSIVDQWPEGAMPELRRRLGA